MRLIDEYEDVIAGVGILRDPPPSNLWIIERTKPRLSVRLNSRSVRTSNLSGKNERVALERIRQAATSWASDISIAVTRSNTAIAWSRDTVG